MKLSKLLLLSAVVAAPAIHADLKSDFRHQLHEEAKVAAFKNATQSPLAPRKLHIDVKASDLCKKLPKLTLVNDEIASAVTTDAIKTLMKFKIDSKAAAKNAGISAAEQAAKTYTAEQLVAALVWAAHKIQEKTGLKAPAALKPVLENEYVAWFTGVAAKTVARAAADTAINFGLNKYSQYRTPGNPGNGGPAVD